MPPKCMECSNGNIECGESPCGVGAGAFEAVGFAHVPVRLGNIILFHIRVKVSSKPVYQVQGGQPVLDADGCPKLDHCAVLIETKP